MSTEHNEHQKAYFTDRSLPRMASDRAATPYVQRHVHEALKAASVGQEELILDVGCGPGKYTAAIDALGHRVEGLDLTPALIDSLRQRHPHIPAHIGDAARPDKTLLGRYDLAVGFFVLHHVEDLTGIFDGVRSTLRPGGRAVFLEPNPLFLGYYAQIAFTPGMTWRGERGIVRMRRAVIERAGRAAGFARIDSWAFGAMPPAIANRPWGRRFERLFEAIPGWRTVGAFNLFTLA